MSRICSIKFYEFKLYSLTPARYWTTHTQLDGNRKPCKLQLHALHVLFYSIECVGIFFFMLCAFLRPLQRRQGSREERGLLLRARSSTSWRRCSVKRGIRTYSCAKKWLSKSIYLSRVYRWVAKKLLLWWKTPIYPFGGKHLERAKQIGERWTWNYKSRNFIFYSKYVSQATVIKEITIRHSKKKTGLQNQRWTSRRMLLAYFCSQH